jgi:hypothetical protein
MLGAESTNLAELHWQCATAWVADGVVEEGGMDVDVARRTGGADVPHKDNRLR